MGKNDFFQNTYNVEKDKLTERAVTRLTSEGTVNHHLISNKDNSMLVGDGTGNPGYLYIVEMIRFSSITIWKIGKYILLLLTAKQNIYVLLKLKVKPESTKTGYSATTQDIYSTMRF
jgi:hypothetical protein